MKTLRRVSIAACYCFLISLFVSPPATGASRDDLEKSMQLNESGIQKAHSGNFDGAEIDLLQALEYSGQNPRIRQNLAGVYYEKGVRHLKGDRNLYEAERYLKLALESDPGNPKFKKAWASFLYLKGDERAARGDPRAALSFYEESAKADPANVNAWIQASHYAWNIQEIEKAREYYVRARKLDPANKNVKVLAERLTKAAGAEEGGAKQESEHFILSADGRILTEAGAHRLLYELEQAYSEVGYQLSVYPRDKISVVFYPAKDFHDHWRLPNRVKGYFDGKLRIPYSDPKINPETMRPVFRHELTHSLISRINPKGIPQWLNEGVAQWVEGKKMSMKEKDALVIYQISRRVPDIRHLDGILSAQKNSFNNTEMTLACMKSLSLVEYLIDQFGVWVLLEIVKNYEQDNLEQLFEKHCHESVSEFEGKWLRWIESKKY